jgi:hypothetical protein
MGVPLHDCSEQSSAYLALDYPIRLDYTPNELYPRQSCHGLVPHFQADCGISTCKPPCLFHRVPNPS